MKHLVVVVGLASVWTSLTAVGADRRWGLHFDFHAGPAPSNAVEVAIGATLKEADIAEICDALKPDFLQIDCKGHPGWTSYPSKCGNAMPKFAGDPLRTWRKVTSAKGVPLYMHYSGIYDVRYCRHNPSEAVVDAEGRRTDSAKPDGRYADELLIPQLCELAGDYGVDGVWIDGDCWGVKCDYDPRTVARFERATGIQLNGIVPKKVGDAHFDAFREYFRGLYRQYLNHVVDGVHAKYPKFRICSNWSYSLYRPDDIDANVDFISGDLASTDSFYSSRLAGRLNARHGKPWDLMSWEFRYDWKPKSAHVPKHPVQLMQEAASVLSLGGGFQVYITQQRDGSPRMDQIRALKPLADFVRARVPYAFGGNVRRDLALLLPVTSQYAQSPQPFGMSGQYCTGGILNLLCDAGRSTRVATETDLAPEKIGQWQVIVIPQLFCALPKATMASLTAWTKAGGKLVLAGAETCRFFAAAGYPSSVNDDLFTHQRLFTTDGGKTRGSFEWSATLADGSGEILARTIEGDRPFAAVRPFGRGQVAVLAAEVGYSYENSGQYLQRALFDAILDRFYTPAVRLVSATGLVEVSALEKDGKLFVQLVNANGQHHNAKTFSENFLPPALDVKVRLALPKRPSALVLQPAGRPLDFAWQDGVATFTLPRLDIYDIVEVR